MRTSFLLCIVVAASFHVQAQYFRPGYIVTVHGDTLKGLINDAEWAYNPTEIEFKANENAEVQTFGTTALRSFVTSRPATYEAHTFKYDGDFLHVTGFTDQTYPRQRAVKNWIETTCFLRVVARGKYNLYVFSDARERAHYLIRERGSAEVSELPYREFIPTVFQGRDAVGLNLVKAEEYKQQLLNISQSCEGLKNRILGASYTETALRQIVNEINDCHGENTSDHEIYQTNKTLVEFGVAGHAFIWSLTAYVDYVFNSYKAEFNFNKVAGAGGIYCEVFSRQRERRLSWYNELKWLGYQKKKDTDRSEPGIRTSSLRLVSMVRVSPKRQASLYVMAGLNAGRRRSLSLSPPTTAGIKYGSNLEFGPGGGFGKRFLNFSATAEFRYNYVIPLIYNHLKPEHTMELSITKKLFGRK